MRHIVESFFYSCPINKPYRRKNIESQGLVIDRWMDGWTNRKNKTIYLLLEEGRHNLSEIFHGWIFGLKLLFSVEMPS
jgi:DNA-binding PadR family transcriptional regulator